MQTCSRGGGGRHPHNRLLKLYKNCFLNNSKAPGRCDPIVLPPPSLRGGALKRRTIYRAFILSYLDRLRSNPALHLSIQQTCFLFRQSEYSNYNSLSLRVLSLLIKTLYIHDVVTALLRLK